MRWYGCCYFQHSSIYIILSKRMFTPAYGDVNLSWFNTDGSVSIAKEIKELKGKNSNEFWDLFDARIQVINGAKQAPVKLPPVFAGELYTVFGLISDSTVNLGGVRVEVKTGWFYHHVFFSFLFFSFLFFSFLCFALLYYYFCLSILIVPKASGPAGKIVEEIHMDKGKVVQDMLIHILAAKNLIRFGRHFHSLVVISLTASTF